MGKRVISLHLHILIFLTMRELQRKRATLELQSGLMEWKEAYEQLQLRIAKFGGGGTAKKNWQLNKRQ